MVYRGGQQLVTIFDFEYRENYSINTNETSQTCLGASNLKHVKVWNADNSASRKTAIFTKIKVVKKLPRLVEAT